MAVVLQAEGSTPCKAGASAIVDAAGAIRGTIGGGLIEAEAQRRAVEAIRTRQPDVFDFRLEGDTVASGTPICGGTVRVLIDPTGAQHRKEYVRAAATQETRARGALLTTIRGEGPWEVAVRFVQAEAIPPDLEFPGPEAVRAAIESERAAMHARKATQGGPRLEVLVEPLVPRPLLLVVGGGHVGQAVAVQSDLVGFEVTVLDDRPEFAAAERFPPGVAVRCGPIGAEVAGFPLGPDSYVVIVARDHAHDAEALAACLHRRAAFVGMIGSRRKVAMMRKEFIESGKAAAEEIDRVYAPIGLDIGAVTVPEIAASIVAQLIAVRRRGAAPRIPIG